MQNSGTGTVSRKPEAGSRKLLFCFSSVLIAIVQMTVTRAKMFLPKTFQAINGAFFFSINLFLGSGWIKWWLRLCVSCEIKWCVFDHQRRSEVGWNFNWVHTEIEQNFIDNWDSSNAFPILMFYFSILPQRIFKFDFYLILVWRN